MSIDIESQPTSVAAKSTGRIDPVFWAQHDPDTEELYAGQWVVAHEGKIVAHGIDIELVRREAARITGREPEELVVCAIPRAESWLADA